MDRGSWPSSVFSDRNVLATVSSRICFSLIMSPVSTWRSTTSSSSVMFVLLVFSDLDMFRGIDRSVVDASRCCFFLVYCWRPCLLNALLLFVC